MNSVEKLVSLMKSHPILSILKHISLHINILIFIYDFVCLQRCRENCVSPSMNECTHNFESITHHPFLFSFFCLIRNISISSLFKS